MKTRFIRLVIFSLATLLPAIASHAQNGGGIGFFLPGVNTVKFTDLNTFLPQGSPEITSKPFTTAGSGYGIFYGIVIGGQGGTMHAGSFIKGNQQIDLEGEFGFFSLGYVALNKKGFILYPTVSIGDNTISMYFHQKDQTSSFQTITTEPFQAARLVYQRPMLKFSLAGNYALMGSKNDGGAAGLMIGIEAGYQMPYKEGVWTYDNGAVTDGPDFDNSGFFVSLAIGGGGVMRNNK